MTTTFSIKSILAVSLVLIMGSTAGAIVTVPLNISGCTAIKRSLGQCSVFVDGILKGLGNVSQGNNFTPTAFAVSLSRISGRIFCKNPAGNSLEGNGVPFADFEVPIQNADTINPASISKNGKTLSEVDFHDAQIILALAEAGLAVSCQNSNWIQVIVVTKMEVMGQQLSDLNPSDNNDGCFLPQTGALTIDSCNIDDTLRVSCRIQDPYFIDPKSAVGKNYNYGDEVTGTGSCTVICHSTDSAQCNLNTP